MEVTGVAADSSAGEAPADRAEIKTPPADSGGLDAKSLQRELQKTQAELKALQEADEKRKQESMSELDRERAARQKAEDSARSATEKAVAALKRAAVLAAAGAAGALDASDVYRLGDLSQLEIDEASGDVRGAAELVADLKKSKPHLFGQPVPPVVGSGGGNSGRTPGGAVSVEQFRDLKGEKWKEFQARVARGEVKIQ